MAKTVKRFIKTAGNKLIVQPGKAIGKTFIVRPGIFIYKTAVKTREKALGLPVIKPLYQRYNAVNALFEKKITKKQPTNAEMSKQLKDLMSTLGSEAKEKSSISDELLKQINDCNKTLSFLSKEASKIKNAASFANRDTGAIIQNLGGLNIKKEQNQTALDNAEVKLKILEKKYGDTEIQSKEAEKQLIEATNTIIVCKCNTTIAKLKKVQSKEQALKLIEDLQTLYKRRFILDIIGGIINNVSFSLATVNYILWAFSFVSSYVSTDLIPNSWLLTLLGITSISKIAAKGIEYYTKYSDIDIIAGENSKSEKLIKTIYKGSTQFFSKTIKHLRKSSGDNHLLCGSAIVCAHVFKMIHKMTTVSKKMLPNPIMEAMKSIKSGKNVSEEKYKMILAYAFHKDHKEDFLAAISKKHATDIKGSVKLDSDNLTKAYNQIQNIFIEKVEPAISDPKRNIVLTPEDKASIKKIILALDMGRYMAYAHLFMTVTKCMAIFVSLIAKRVPITQVIAFLPIINFAKWTSKKLKYFKTIPRMKNYTYKFLPEISRQNTYETVEGLLTRLKNKIAHR